MTDIVEVPVPAGMGIPLVDMTTHKLPTPTMQAIAAETGAAIDSALAGYTPTVPSHTHTQSQVVDLVDDLQYLRDSVDAVHNEATDAAGLNHVGWLKAVFIPHNGTIPAGTPAYTLVIEAGV